MINIRFLSIYLLCYCFQVCFADTWITLWNKIDSPVEIQCKREGLFKKKDFKAKIIKSNDRYDIKAYVDLNIIMFTFI